MRRALARFRPFTRPYRRRLAAGTALAVVEIGFGLAQPWPLSFIVDRVLAPDGAPPARPGLLIGIAVTCLVAVVAGAALADYWSTWLMASAGQRTANDMRLAVFSHLQRLSLRYHGEHPVGDLATRVTSDVDRVQDMLVQILAVLVPNALLLAGMVAVMVVVDAALALLALAFVPLLALAVVRSTRALREASRRARAQTGLVAAVATETFGAIDAVQALTMEPSIRDRFGWFSARSLDAGLEAARHDARFSPLVDTASVLSLAAVIAVGSQRVLAGSMSLGLLLVFVTYVGSMYKPLKALAKLGGPIGKGAAAAERLEAVLAEDPDVRDAPDAMTAPRLRGRVTFEGVHFDYGREAVLRGVDLDIAPGETIAVVGATGAGKSTLVGLVPRLFDVTAGAVRVDGIDVRSYTVASLRQQVAMVLQDTVLFSGTLAENIALARPGATFTEVAHAARLARVDEFADRLPRGLATQVGERGAQLSGGQRQRVAIARALLRDAPVLVLDEPTSALDADAEQLVMAAIEAVAAGRTTLVVAHRLSTVRRADRIVVLDHGRIVEIGTHGELLAAGGRYAELHRHATAPGPGRRSGDEAPSTPSALLTTSTGAAIR